MSHKISSWITLSPRDWMIILDSLSLVWNQSRFIEDFGTEKLKLQTVWMNIHGTFGSFFKVNVPSSISNPHPNDRICLRAYRDKTIRTAPPTTIRMPDSLVDPSHWGFLAWKYINFDNLRHDSCGGQKSAKRLRRSADGFEWFQAHPNNDTVKTCVVCQRPIHCKTQISDGDQMQPLSSVIKSASNAKPGKNNYYNTLSIHSKRYGCKLWCVFNITRNRPTAWEPFAYAILPLGHVTRRRSLWLREVDFATKKLLLRVLEIRFEEAKASLAINGFQEHRYLWTGTERQKVSTIKTSLGKPFTLQLLEVFLPECSAKLDGLWARVQNCLNHTLFDTHVCPEYTRERFINDLNMAMSCHDETESFFKRIEDKLVGISALTSD